MPTEGLGLRFLNTNTIKLTSNLVCITLLLTRAMDQEPTNFGRRSPPKILILFTFHYRSSIQTLLNKSGDTR